VVLHIGAMKTGTSTLQAVLGEHADALAAAGVLYPHRPGWVVQVRAVRDALDVPGVDSKPGRWADMAERLRTHDGPLAVLSMEFLSFANAERARAITESLAPADVHVALTLRDASRVLPSAWQEWTQNRGDVPWSSYLEAVEQVAPGAAPRRPGPRTSAEKQARRVLDTERMLTAWSSAVPAGNVHVVTVPPPGAAPRLLWERFASLLEIDPAPYDLPTAAANESIGFHAADLMWRVNRALSDLDFAAYNSAVKLRLCKQVLAARSEKPPVPLPESARDFAARWAQHTGHLVEQVGADVVGDLAELEPVPGRFVPGPAPSADPAAVVDVARDAVAGLGGELDGVAPADVETAVGAVAARVRQVLHEQEPSRATRQRGRRGLLRSWRGGRRPS
jgi:hypothetical protein